MRIILLYLLATANLIAIIHIGLYMIGANAYDILRFKKAHELSKRKLKTSTKEPKYDLVSVVIPAHNEAKVIRRTINSVLASSYSNFEIIIINDGSTDKTETIVHDYISRIHETTKLRVATYLGRDGRAFKFKRRYIRVYNNQNRIKLISQRNTGKASAMNNAMKNEVRGRYVMCLDADSILHPQAIERAVSYFKDNHVIGVAANVRVIENKTLLGKVQRFEHMIGYRSKKFYSLTNSEFIIGGVASTYRRSILRKVKFYDDDTMTEDIGLSLKIIAKEGNRKHRVIYAADVLAFTEGVQTFKDLMKQRYRWKMGNLQNLYKYRHLIGKYDPESYSRALTMYRLPMAILSEILLIIDPILISYIIYLSIAYHTLGIPLGAYLTITVYTLCVLWPDEHLNIREKLKMSLTASVIYILFYTMDIVQVCAIFKSLFNYKKIIHRETSSSVWIPPTRSGQTVRI